MTILPLAVMAGEIPLFFSTVATDPRQVLRR